MRRLVAPCAALLLLVATTAHAGAGVNLRWSNCFGDGGTLNRNFACNTNSGSNVLVSSFVLAQTIPQASGQEIVLELATASAVLPAWWAFRTTGTCRQNSMSANFTLPATAVNCVDWAAGQAVGFINGYSVQFNPNDVRLFMASAVPAEARADLVAGPEYFSNNLVINNQKTVGTGACAGCEVPACIVLLSIKVTTPIPSNDRAMSGPTNNTDSHYATWQGGGSPVTWRGTGCPRATPARQETWGAVKSLYR